jgi:type IV secretory pathway VirD2 relaxase
MFINGQKTFHHQIDLLPTHIRYAKSKHRIFKPRTGGSRGSSYFAGHGIFSLLAHRNQQCVVKISYAKNTKTRSWAAHGEYLQREHAQTVGEKGLGFNSQSEAVDLKLTLRQWQKENDEHVFKLIISPENGHQLDLKQHARELMQQVQRDLKTKLEWAAINHHNTDHPHLHILIRGIDDQRKALIIERDYLSHGFRRQSEDLATRVLGIRLNRDIVQARTRQVEREYVTGIDRNILRKAEKSIVNYHTPAPDNVLSREQRLLEIRRLKFLETLGLAEQIGNKAWKLSSNLELALQQRQLSNDIIKSQANHNISSITNEMPIPTQIHEHKPLTGKVVGMGLENELKDQRYLLLEGIDGKVHYLQATNSIVKARDNFEFGNNDIITLEKKKFVNRQRETIEYVKIQNHFSLGKLQRVPHSRLDRDVIEFVKTHGMRPNHYFPEKSFAHEYANAMTIRFHELEREKIFIKENEQYRLTSDWERKLERTQRQLNLTNELATNEQIQSYEHYLKRQHQRSLDNLGGRNNSQDQDRHR